MSLLISTQNGPVTYMYISARPSTITASRSHLASASTLFCFKLEAGRWLKKLMMSSLWWISAAAAQNRLLNLLCLVESILSKTGDGTADVLYCTKCQPEMMTATLLISTWSQSITGHVGVSETHNSEDWSLARNMCIIVNLKLV